MTNSKDYLPHDLDKLDGWCGTYEQNIDAVAFALALTAQQLSDQKDTLKMITGSISNSKKAKADFASAIAASNKDIAKGVTGMRAFVREMKANPKYSEDLGKALGIIGVDSHVDNDTYKPHLEAQVFADHVTLKFTKKGVEGVNVYSRLAGETKWMKLSYDSHSPYVDNRPLAHDGIAEKREYMCMGVVHDAEIGLPSDIVSVLFGG